MNKNKWLWLAIVGGLLVSAPLMAKKTSELQVINPSPATTAAEFSDQAQAVRAAMEDGGRFSEISSSNKKRVNELLIEIANFMVSGGFTELSVAHQTQMINAQEEANAILTKNDGDRLICTHERPTGTRFKQKVCRTADEIAERRRIDTDRNNFARGVQEPYRWASKEPPGGK